MREFSNAQVEGLVEAINDLLGYLTREQYQPVFVAKEAAMHLAEFAISTGDGTVSPAEVQDAWRDGVDLLAADEHSEHDGENCGACHLLEDTCPYHRGVETGIALLRQGVDALADLPDELNSLLAVAREVKRLDAEKAGA